MTLGETAPLNYGLLYACRVVRPFILRASWTVP